MRLYWAFARVGFVNTLAYRLRYFTGIVTYFIYVSVYYFIWKAIYEHSKSIEGFDFAHLLTYIGVGWIIRSFYFNNIDQDLAYQVMEGRLAMDLIKPVNIQMMYVARAAGESVFRLALLTLPTAVVLFWYFPCAFRRAWAMPAAFLVSVGFSFLIVAAINFAVGTFALRLQSILGLLRAKFFLLELFSGLLLPMTFFPHLVQKILDRAAVPIHQLHSDVDILGQTSGRRACQGDCAAGFLGGGAAGNRRRAVEMVYPESDYSGWVKYGRRGEDMLRKTFVTMLLLLGLASALAADDHPILPLGAPAPDFCLPGIDDKTHCLKDYAASKILVIVFTCNHCPTAQLYESRIKRLVSDYENRGVAFVAIEPNDPMALRLDEMGYTDVGDTFEEMKIRAAYRHFNFPYLYDGKTQSVARAYGPSATPHVFIFDSERKLRYEGRVDNNPREQYVTQQDARNALDALLAGKPVALAKTPSFGCSTKWASKEEGRKAEMAAIETRARCRKAGDR